MSKLFEEVLQVNLERMKEAKRFEKKPKFNASLPKTQDPSTGGKLEDAIKKSVKSEKGKATAISFIESLIEEGNRPGHQMNVLNQLLEELQGDCDVNWLQHVMRKWI